MKRSSRNLFWTAAVFVASAGVVLAQEAETSTGANSTSEPAAVQEAASSAAVPSTVPASAGSTSTVPAVQEPSVLAELGVMADQLTEAGVPDAMTGVFLEIEFENQAVLHRVSSRVVHSSHPRASAMMARKIATERHAPQPMMPRLHRLLENGMKGRELAGAMAKMVREHHASHPGHPAVQRLAAKGFHMLREKGLSGQELVTRFQVECQAGRARVSKIRDARRGAAATEEAHS